MIWTKAFWKGAAERAIKTLAQTLGGYLVVGVTGILDLDWTGALSVAGASALASVLTSIANPEFVAGKTVEVVVEDTSGTDGYGV